MAVVEDDELVVGAFGAKLVRLYDVGRTAFRVLEARRGFLERPAALLVSGENAGLVDFIRYRERHAAVEYCVDEADLLGVLGPEESRSTVLSDQVVDALAGRHPGADEIGRASCRERGESAVEAGSV